MYFKKNFSGKFNHISVNKFTFQNSFIIHSLVSFCRKNSFIMRRQYEKVLRVHTSFFAIHFDYISMIYWLHFPKYTAFGFTFRIFAASISVVCVGCVNPITRWDVIYGGDVCMYSHIPGKTLSMEYCYFGRLKYWMMMLRVSVTPAVIPVIHLITKTVPNAFGSRLVMFQN